MTAPADVAALLAGSTEDGAWEIVLPLLTVDPDGYPRVCMLSRAEVEADATVFRCVARGRRATANVHRDGRALLVVVHRASAHYLRLRLLRTATDDQETGATAMEFAIEGREEDSRQTPLRPMTFLAGAAVRHADRTHRNPALLSRLSAPGADARQDD